MTALDQWRKAVHSSDTAEHWSPPEIVEPSRIVLGGFDLDPASSEGANQLVAAKRIYTKEQDGKTLPWEGVIWCNPPSKRGEESAADWWIKAGEEFVAGRATAIVFVLFNLSAVQVAQSKARKAGLPLPQDAARCEFGERVDYLKGSRVIDLFGERWHYERGGAPPHPSAILLLSDDEDLIDRWREAHEPIGATLGPRMIPPRRP